MWTRWTPGPPDLSTVVKAGAAYFAVVFAAGFILGAVRVIAVAPALGETRAVLLESPVILSVSWVASMHVTRRYKLGLERAPRLLMGAIAFILLMSVEFGLSIIMFQRTAAAYFAAYRTAPGMIGLIAQLAFAIVPTIQRPSRR
jgi:hypothetical protein